MRPTFSILFFTVLSGAGYGLWLLTGLALALPWAQGSNAGASATIAWPALAGYGLGAGFLLVSAGLLSSLGHLGKPGRAWRAFSQWRSSWLSREGVAAVLTYIPVAAVGLAACSGAWPSSRPGDALLRAAALLIVAGSVATVFCTANIYACLKPVRAWHNPYVVAGYLLLGAYSGGLWAWALASLAHGQPAPVRVLPAGLVVAAVAGAILKLSYWRFLDGDKSPATAGDATGLGNLGTVRPFEHPHTEENYLTREMGFRLARKHARKLRRIALVGAFAIPALLALVVLLVPATTWLGWFALVAGMAGLFVERWLFFAEAKHAVMLYYGARTS